MTEVEPNYDFRDALVVIADAPGAAAVASEAAESAGKRVARTMSFAEAIDDLGAEGALGGLLVEARDVDDALLDVALARVAAVSATRDLPVVVALDDRQIDAIWSQLAGPAVTLLCEPTPTDRVAAITLMPLMSDQWHDVGRDESERLRALNAEVARIADTLAQLSRGVADRTASRTGLREAPLSFGAEPGAAGTGTDAVEIRNLIRARRMRTNHFSGELFADPAWDMLLDLYAAELEHRRVSVSSLCIAAAVPGTTALRWIGTMVDSGLFERHADRLDRRRAYVGLSDRARLGLNSYFQALRQAGLRPA